ncbi:hypothetical protein BJ122_101153 [Rhodopseudomonas faecalis]|uniref:Epoxyqueuosine reductase QueH n=1 Tax=Rhodopseudomonas faecalis TaxID=99655 RepID=A0A318TL95_9BRAD|nr:epoxyqueuosine reductase QueH [Rhodopseudomonas faecalis]PYF05414.1 hypothetical protein BJ122_101153 [Rhodopseudomonas faecalis]TAH67394.1 MAG: epoxyqueuosine reductase QueH [Rhodopseudomonas palustris]
MDTLGRPKLSCPCDQSKVLLHCCCAPCAGEVIETLLWSQIDHTIFFYNPNIHPRREYFNRKAELQRFAIAHGIPFVDFDYDSSVWFARVRGLEAEPERGARCSICFDLRLEQTARYAHANNFPVIATSLGISRWKNINQVDASGQRAVADYPGLIYWGHNWRKRGGADRSQNLAKQQGFYRQDYCGCTYSRRRSKVTSDVRSQLIVT